jgi:GH25 family lysozyme M1 (1,4-beta-N-acetylmuramidase)
VVRALLPLSLLSACTSTYLPPHGPPVDAAARRVCASGDTVEGIDVSYWQGDVDWDRVARTDLEFAIVRVSDGGFADPEFADNWSELRRVGLVRGAYQYFRAGQGVAAQADRMIDAVRDLGPGDLAPVLDVETADGVSGATVVARAREWLDRVEAATGRVPIVYAASGFWNTLPDTDDFDRYPLWVANYGATCPSMPDPWADWAMWQYTDSGSVPGVSGPVDTNVFQGDVDDLQRFAGLPDAPIAVDWARQPDGAWAFTAVAPPDVTRVKWFVDGYELGAVTGSGTFSLRYRFTSATAERHLTVTGFDAAGHAVARGVGLFDAVAGTGVFVRQVGQATYDVGLERAPAAVAAIELSADGWPVTDDVTGDVHTARRAARHTYSELGERAFELDTFGADGRLRGTLRRTFTLE